MIEVTGKIAQLLLLIHEIVKGLKSNPTKKGWESMERSRTWTSGGEYKQLHHAELKLAAGKREWDDRVGNKAEVHGSLKTTRREEEDRGGVDY